MFSDITTLLRHATAKRLPIPILDFHYHGAATSLYLCLHFFSLGGPLHQIPVKYVLMCMYMGLSNSG